MHIEFLLEEPSAEAFLRNLIPKMLGAVSFRTHPHRGKADLLAKLPARLKAYRKWLPEDWFIVVLVDEDRDPDGCEALKARMERVASDTGFVTKAVAAGKREFRVLNRIAIEEIEAWYFGDVQALVTAYPGVPASLGEKARFRDPDAIKSGTWEALLRILRKAGYYREGLPKLEVARAVSAHMDPQRNRSRSFQVFRDGLLAMAALRREPA
ncbi:MAG: DUF4276 family protein [Planctomycetes bacterium]|nr:DUF4276 family protein [Planctomycetota bacterium]